jgi:ribosomal-protein-alanine N-acetyltransferase
MESHYQVRSATPADVPAVAAIERVVFADPWSATAFHAMLGPHALVAVTDGQIEGYIFARAMADEGELLNVAVRADSRRKGLGRYLVDTILEDFRTRGVQTVYLEVRASNAAGRAFYDTLGFHEIGRRRGYYSRPREDALVLARKLAPDQRPRRSG